MSRVHYEFSVPAFAKGLGAVKKILEVAADLAKGHPEGEVGVLGARIAPDMFPLVKQVQIAGDNAKGAVARLTGKTAPTFADDEITIAQLQARLDTTIAFLESVSPEDFESAETREVHLPYFPDSHMLGDGYLKSYALPNFYFHVTTAYDIVRMLGGQLGKGDFINGLPLIKNEG